MANWVWSALSALVLFGDWALGSWLFKFKALTSPPARWAGVRFMEATVAFVFVGVAIVQFFGQR